ncbi:LOW QUALITY PROTEIN: proteinase-activated receptor 4 [Heteronotia binoei]|uniref:LOW QUALITY PROTEIN: proteinase-activated receptor 4 n=1 Tax=Heteronotia binoei TaxID=13085 RepID=UPI0029316C06|nr:LOW QUALITY PROTEIN: proteinase-activated receptor 4 [Heteronotia binoei]
MGAGVGEEEGLQQPPRQTNLRKFRRWQCQQVRALRDQAKSSWKQLVGVESACNVDCKFKLNTHKMLFVTNAEDYMYRRGALSRASRAQPLVLLRHHRRFEEWHQGWLGRHVAAESAELVQDWLMGDEDEDLVPCKTTCETTSIHGVPVNRYRAQAGSGYGLRSKTMGPTAPLTTSRPPLPLGCGPRAIPGQVVRHNGTLFLAIPAASRLQLSSRLFTLLLPCAYLAIFLVGLPLNGLALVVLAAHVEKLPSTVFLMNLAVADLLLALLLPFKIAYYFLGNHWPFGEGMCRFAAAAFYGNMYGSMLLLACISVDRYLAVAHPFFARSCRSLALATGTCAVVWLAAVLLVVPLTLHRQSFPLNGTGLTVCHDVLPRVQEAGYYYYYFLCLVTCGFLAPLLAMVLSSGATLRALLGSGERYATAIKLTALVLSTMLVFYTPSNVLLLLHYTDSCSQRQEGTLYVAYMVSLALTACNSCADPFVYYYASEEFRAKEARKQLRWPAPPPLALLLLP